MDTPVLYRYSSMTTFVNHQEKLQQGLHNDVS